LLHKFLEWSAYIGIPANIGLLGFGVYHDSTYYQVLALVNILLLGVIFIHKKDN
jgi:hypothetical protein